MLRSCSVSSALEITGLEAGIDDRQILFGIDLEIRSGEVHVVMGPNGAGKSTLSNVLMGHPSYVVTAGSILLDGEELVGLPTYRRAELGLFLAQQDPIEVPGVRIEDLLSASTRTASLTPQERRSRLVAEAERIGVPLELMDRSVNADASGGQKKRLETLQLALFAPRIAILDELDSGLDVDALRDVAARVYDEVVSPADDRDPLGVLAITHYSRIFEELHPQFVHVLVNGRIVESGGLELAAELEANGYGRFIEEKAASTTSIFDI
jgi:Fe-S cluster assembly ATP-binding protein